MRIYVLGNAISSFFVNFPIPISRTLLPRSPAITIAIIIDFIYRKSSEDILFTIVISLTIAFIALLVVLSSYVGIYANITILPLIFSSRTMS